MGGEKPSQPEHEGEKYLELLGLGHLASLEIATSEGIREGRDFLDICGDRARGLVVRFEAMSPQDPRYETSRDAIRTLIIHHVSGDESSH